jgi:hypothetical protein
LITSCRLRTRDSARGRSAMVDTFMGRMLQPAQSIHAGMRARGVGRAPVGRRCQCDLIFAKSILERPSVGPAQ